MVTRRDVVTTGALGALAAAADGGAGDGAAAAASGDVTAAQPPDLVSAQALRELADQVVEIRRLMRDYNDPSAA